jgi:acetylornithine deacetylase/succinyl-diaminopimelate desuccinylase-like protein
MMGQPLSTRDTQTSMKEFVRTAGSAVDWRMLPDLSTFVIRQALAIQQIPAPTFAEQRRAAYVEQAFTANGLTQVSTDEQFNVYGLLPGLNSAAPAVMITAHTDTIFPEDTDLTTQATSGIINGPGLGDNSVGVAGLLGLAQALRHADIRPSADFWFVATTREEGLGDLGGIKAAFERLRDRVGTVINIEGLAFGHIYHAGIAVRRLHVTATAPGGHSWLHFGKTSAVHSILELGSRIIKIQPTASPRTTYNIGMIEGGKAINAIASNAGLWIDMRSESREALTMLEQQIRAQIDATHAPDLSLKVEIVGDRPAGSIAIEHPLVQGALATLAQVGVKGILETGSTDGNVPLAEGCPTVTVGVTRGGNAHRLDEYIETAPISAGMRQLVTLTLATATYLSRT